MAESYVLRVNGVDHAVTADSSRTLLGVIRDEVGLTGTKEGCDDCECGACTVLLVGRPVNSCSYLAAQAVDREITTIEGVMSDDDLHPLQAAMLAEGGVQCGFCTPGIVMSAHALLSHRPDPSDEEIRMGLAGNLCRCTGYTKIRATVRRVADAERP